MARDSRGFTLIEALITSTIIVIAMAGAASLFSYSSVVNWDNRQRTLSTILIADKMEELKASAFQDATWTPGGGLDPQILIPGYFDRVAAGGSGEYLRLWQLNEDSGSCIITVAVYARRTGTTSQRWEIGRASTVVSAGRGY